MGFENYDLVKVLLTKEEIILDPKMLVFSLIFLGCRFGDSCRKKGAFLGASQDIRGPKTERPDPCITVYQRP